MQENRSIHMTVPLPEILDPPPDSDQSYAGPLVIAHLNQRLVSELIVYQFLLRPSRHL